MKQDEKTFTEIVKKYQQPLYRYIRRMVIRHEDSEDILQETFVKAFRHLWQIRSESALQAWLYKIATNETRRHLRRHAAEILLDGEGTEAPVHPSEEPGIDARKADSVTIPAALQHLSPLEREVFCLRYYDDLDYEQISRITGATKNTLMVSWHSAKEKIKKELFQ